MTDRVSDEALLGLITAFKNQMAVNYIPLTGGGKSILSALTELRERREAERKDASDYYQECPYCGEFHDKRVACTPYVNKRFPDHD